MKKAVRSAAVILAVFCSVILAVCAYLGRALPDSITAYENSEIVFKKYSLRDLNTVFVNICHDNEKKQAAYIFDNTVSTDDLGEITLFHIIPIKTVSVHRQKQCTVIPCGTLFGIKLHTKGAAVIKCCNVLDEKIGKTRNPAAECGLKVGDTICAVNGTDIKSYRDAEKLTEESGGDTLVLSCMRGEKNFTAEITPALCGGRYRLGLWIRDSAAGLGTMTFYDPESGRFASLGHGVCDDETGSLLPIDKAQIIAVEVAGITKGTNGSAGSINGYFSDLPPIGLAYRNTENGLFGELIHPIDGTGSVEIAAAQETVKGRAQILCTTDHGKAELYDIEITGIDYDDKNKTKNLEITVCDQRLIDKTGGIIQGMSGSPILQNGKLAGAVTHVLITNSVKGYGIFAQNMFDELDKEQI